MGIPSKIFFSGFDIRSGFPLRSIEKMREILLIRCPYWQPQSFMVMTRKSQMWFVLRCSPRSLCPLPPSERTTHWRWARATETKRCWNVVDSVDNQRQRLLSFSTTALSWHPNNPSAESTLVVSVSSKYLYVNFLRLFSSFSKAPFSIRNYLKEIFYFPFQFSSVSLWLKSRFTN